MKSISPLRYPGGKSRACKKFLKYLPEYIDSICSPFYGGGAFEIHCLRNYQIKIFGYDLSEPLVAFWSCLIQDPERLARIVTKYLPVVTKEQFYRLQRTFRQIEDSWERGAAAYILNRTSFSGTMESGGMSPLEDDGRNGRFKESNVRFLNNFRVPEGMLSVQRLSFEKSIVLHPESFVYADPPYLVGISFTAGVETCTTLTTFYCQRFSVPEITGCSATTIVLKCESCTGVFTLSTTEMACRGTTACQNQKVQKNC
ncbi:MAG: DNA adenine methylase [Desulfomonilaceae bacterium]